MRIAVYGPGCPRCVQTEKNVKQALAELKIEAEVIKVTDIKEYAKAGVVFTPAVAVDGKVMISGKIPTVEEIRNILS